MHFVVFASDRPLTSEIRAATRAAHRAYLDNPEPHKVKVIFAGPTLDADGETLNGSLIIIETDDMGTARKFVMDDPYNRANLFGHVEIRPWNWIIGKPGA